MVGVVLAASLAACRFYSFKGGNLNPQIKTFTLHRVQNQAAVVNPRVAPSFEEAFRDYLLRETTLQEVPTNADLTYRIVITDYSVRPMAVAVNQPQTNRFTIAARVEFRNAVEPRYNLDRTFSAYVDFEAEQNFADVEEELTEELIRRLVEDIYNATVNAW